MNIDMSFVRAQFPSLDNEWLLLDNAGGSQIAKPVVDRLNDYLSTSNVQLGGSYAISRLADQRVSAGIETMAGLINAPSSRDVVLGSSTTMLMRILSLSMSRALTPGDEVIVTNCDHEANIGAWVDLANYGLTIKTWELNRDTLELEIEDLEKLLDERTRLVALTHASNVLGTPNPIAEIARVVHDAGAWICVDGVAYAPHRSIDVQALDVDFYAFSLYKVYGPHTALLYGREEILDRLPGLNHFFIGEPPQKFQPGGLNYELTASLAGLGDYFSAFSATHGGPSGGSLHECARFVCQVFGAHEEQLSARVLDVLNSKSKVRVIGRTEAARERRMPTISFVVDGKRCEDVVRAVDEYKIGIRWGDFYARRLIDFLGLSEQGGVIRASMVHYNTLEEADRLARALDAVL
jgi:cysteine desulfurase family protein (TIGR01976 family)